MPSAKPESTRIPVRVVPRSSRNKIEIHGEGLKVWITAPPVDGQANGAVCSLLAKSLGIAPSRVAISRGEASREKLIEVAGLTLSEVLGKLG